MPKMTLDDLRSMYPEKPFHFVSPDGLIDTNGATRKRHRHNHKPTWKPRKVKLSPAEYRRRHMGAK